MSPHVLYSHAGSSDSGIFPEIQSGDNHRMKHSSNQLQESIVQQIQYLLQADGIAAKFCKQRCSLEANSVHESHYGPKFNAQ